MSLIRQVKIEDALGNLIDSHLDAGGDYHLGTSLIQTIITSTNNYTDTNLASAATFTGTADETFGISGIQVYHAADQNCTIYIDQSVDNTFADSTQTITDSFNVLANIAISKVFISVAPYYRLRVTNTGPSTTTKIITASGMTPIINPLPRNLSDDNRLKVESTLSGRENTDRHVWINSTNELSISPVYRMVGTTFDGTNKDPNFWTDGSLRDGTVTQDGGEIELETNTTANGYAAYTSARRARFVPGSAQLFTGGFSWETAETADNVRRCGAYDATDGFFFELDGSVFSIGTRIGGVDTLVSSSNFNGNYGPNWSPTIDQYYSLSIEFTPLGVFYYVNKKKLHSIKEAHLTNTLTLPITIENENTNDSTTNVVFDCVGAYIAREGELHTNPTSKYITTAATYVCKYGAGVLHRIIINNPETGTGMTIYDNISATAPVVAVITLGSKAVAPVSIEYGVPFNTGLTIVSTGTWDVTIVYE